MKPQALLARDVGDWSASVTVHMGPDAPFHSTAEMQARLVAGGRWLVMDYLSPESGFGGHGVYGWDEEAGHFVGTWVDNTTGTPRILRGTYDEVVGAMCYEGELAGPPPLRIREITTAPHADERHFSSEILLPSGWTPVLTALYRRR